MPFDVRRLQIEGAPVPLIDEVVAVGNLAVSARDTLVYATTTAFVPNSTLVWVDREGRESPLMDKPRQYVEPRVSPDGRRLAVTLGPDYDVWIQELDRGTLTRLTFGEGNDSLPIWTPDGERVTFSSSSSGPWNIFSVPADGSGEPVQLTSSENLSTASSWSPDGKILAFTHVGQETGVDIGILTMDDEPKTEVFLGTPFNEYHPMFSPDGRWLAYTSDESGRAEVYVRAFPGPGGKWQVSTDGGVYPLWAPSGRELFYRSGDKMMVVPISTAPELRPGTPVVLFEEPYHKLGLAVNNYHSYDVSRDGQQRFVMIKPVEEESAPTQLNVVLNWSEELKRRVPTN